MKRTLRISAWIAVTALAVSLAPTVLAKGSHVPPSPPCKTMPEGGAAFAYLGLAGSVCLGAVGLRRRKNYTE
jgi:hypothetical protein